MEDFDVSAVEFEPFPKLARLSRECVVSEKLDGTNAQILITADGNIYAGSRTRMITPKSDNFGFAAWVERNKDELLKLGEGRHFGEWWGAGIQRGYGLKEKRFSLFNSVRWIAEDLPSCVGVVPELYKGVFDTNAIDAVLERLSETGSVASPGFMNPEGIVVWHVAAGKAFKKTLDNNDEGKWNLA